MCLPWACSAIWDSTLLFSSSFIRRTDWEKYRANDTADGTTAFLAANWPANWLVGALGAAARAAEATERSAARRMDCLLTT